MQSLPDMQPPAKRARLEESEVQVSTLEAIQNGKSVNGASVRHSFDEYESHEPRSESTQTMPQRLTEKDCGIEYFINKELPRFQCTLKEQTSDFQVFEVDRSGQVLKLRNVPQKEDLQREREELRTQNREKAAVIEAQTFDLESESAVTLKSVLGEEAFLKCQELLKSSQEWQGEGANAPLPVLTEVIDDKEKRTSIHKGIREVFLGSLETEAKDDKRMKISYKQKRQGQRGVRGGGRDRGRGGTREQGPRHESWPHAGDYTIFTVYKDGRDTMDVANTLCKIMKAPPKIFGYAGTKDRRGCTVQQFSAYRTTISRLASLNTSGGLRDIVLGDFHYAKKALTLGDLQGNRFVLVLRNIQGSTDEEINASLNLLKETGFVNYYGLQRFGTSSTGTHEVGIHVLRHEFEKACNLILSEHSGARAETKAAKLNWIKTKDAVSTLDMMPSKCVGEVAMLKHMVKTGQKGDWNGAFNSIPRNLRLMYIHSYQSLVWNHIVSRRLEQFGMMPVAGDLILSPLPTPDSTIQGTDDASGPTKEVQRARLITAEECAQYTIYDIVLPLPGCDVTYPETSLKTYYAEFMSQHNLDPFNMVRNTKELSLLGSYRKIMSRPIDLEWEILKYHDAQQQLVPTNLDDLQGKRIDVPGIGPHTALKVGFQLETAAYATMMLREALASVPHTV